MDGQRTESLPQKVIQNAKDMKFQRRRWRNYAFSCDRVCFVTAQTLRACKQHAMSSIKICTELNPHATRTQQILLNDSIQICRVIFFSVCFFFSLFIFILLLFQSPALSFVLAHFLCANSTFGGFTISCFFLNS